MFVHDLVQPDGDGFEVAPCQPAISGKAFGDDEQVAALLCQLFIVQGEEAADIGKRVFLGAHRAAVGIGEDPVRDLRHRGVGKTFFAQPDKVAVLREAAAVDEKGNPVFYTNRLRGFDIFHADRLSAPRIIGDGGHHQRDIRGSFFLYRFFQGFQVHIALEGGGDSGDFSLGAAAVDGFGAGELDIGAGGVEEGVADKIFPFTAEDAEQYFFRRPSLVGGDDEGHARQLVNAVLKAEKAGAAGIGFIALHDAGPLLAAHGRSAAVGEQVDQDIAGADEEGVIMGSRENFFTFLPGGEIHRFDGFDPERFNNGFHADDLAGVTR